MAVAQITQRSSKVPIPLPPPPPGSPWGSGPIPPEFLGSVGYQPERICGPRTVDDGVRISRARAQERAIPARGY